MQEACHRIKRYSKEVLLPDSEQSLGLHGQFNLREIVIPHRDKPQRLTKTLEVFHRELLAGDEDFALHHTPGKTEVPQVIRDRATLETAQEDSTAIGSCEVFVIAALGNIDFHFHI